MNVTVVNSGSDGNCYVVDCDGDILLIECGVRAKEMLNAIDYQTSRVSACIVSHSHSDHIGFLKEYSKYGFPILCSEETYNTPAINFKGGLRPLKRLTHTNLGLWQITPFKVPHNETECDGFLIQHPGMGSMLFITDAELCPYNFQDLHITHVMVECNYSMRYVDLDAPNKEHIFRGHMELQTTKRFIRSLYHPGLESVGLIHISEVNADPEEFKTEIQEECPEALVWIAEKGKKIQL